MTRGQLRPVVIAFGLALGSAAGAQEYVTSVLPPGCHLRAVAAAQDLCGPQTVVFDFGGIAILADAHAPMRTTAWMGTFGLNGPTGIMPPGSDADDTLVALWQRDVTATGSIPSRPSRAVSQPGDRR